MVNVTDVIRTVWCVQIHQHVKYVKIIIYLIMVNVKDVIRTVWCVQILHHVKNVIKIITLIMEYV